MSWLDKLGTTQKIFKEFRKKKAFKEIKKKLTESLKKNCQKAFKEKILLKTASGALFKHAKLRNYYL